MALDGSIVVGVVLCGHDGRRGHIYHLAVDPAYRGYGLGKRLVEECLERITTRPASCAPLSWWPTTIFGGAEFWKRAGWEDIPGAVPMGIDV